jgi:hypothetical protein
MKRPLLVTLAIANALVLTGASVTLSTRAGRPTFSRGGAFGATSTPSGTATPTLDRSVIATTGPFRAAPAATASGTPAGSSGSAPGTVRVPAEGNYRYEGDGHENVNVAGASPCGWDVSTSTLVVKHDTAGTVLDWTYTADRREERQILDYRAGGVFTKFVGAAVTCGIRKESEATYSPPAERLALPLRTGLTWTMTTRSADRTEKIAGEVRSHRSITVRAGTFDAWEVHIRAEVSGNQTGRFEATNWFVPSLGVDAQTHQVTDVTSGSAHFTSDFTIRLTGTP